MNSFYLCPRPFTLTVNRVLGLKPTLHRIHTARRSGKRIDNNTRTYTVIYILLLITIFLSIFPIEIITITARYVTHGCGRT